MTEKQDYTGQIRSKRLKNTGVTEDEVRGLHARRGQYVMGIVELQVDETHEKKDGTRKVDLIISQVELADPENLEPYLREITKALHTNRVLKSEDGQLAIDTSSDVEPKVEDVIAAQRAHHASQPHIFDPAEDGDDCIVCGEDLEHDLHIVLEDPEVEPDDEPSNNADVDEDQLEPAAT